MATHKKLSEDSENSEDFVWDCLPEPLWRPRLYHAAAAIKTSHGYEVDYPAAAQTPRHSRIDDFCFDLWWTLDGQTWTQMAMHDAPDTHTPIVPKLPGLPLGATLAAYPQAVPPSGKVEPDRAFLIGSFKVWATGASDKPLAGTRPPAQLATGFPHSYLSGMRAVHFGRRAGLQCVAAVPRRHILHAGRCLQPVSVCIVTPVTH